MPMQRDHTHLSERYLIFTGALCNLRCKHCYMSKDMQLVVPTWKIIAKMIWCRICRIKDIDITGGEALLHPRIGFIVSFALAIGFREVRVLTNGIARERAQRLADRHKRLRFSLSAHSHLPEEIDAFAGQKGYCWKLYKFIGQLNDRISYINCCPSVFNNNFEDTPITIHRMVPHAPICIKMLGYETGENVPDFLPFSEVNKGIRKLLANFPSARVDFRCFGHCHVDEDIRNHPTVYIFSERNNIYDKNDWQPGITGVTWRHPWMWLIWIFGTSHMREWAAQKVVPEVARHHTLDYSTRCAGCRYIGECDGMEHEYYKRFGFDNEVAIK